LCDLWLNERMMKKFANLHDIKDECRENTTPTCSCKRKNPCVAYDSLVILKCPEQDAVFYMENFLEVIIEFYGYTPSTRDLELNKSKNIKKE